MVPFVGARTGRTRDRVVGRPGPAGDRFADGRPELEVPVFFYGPERPLPEVRREAFLTLDPDAGPQAPHPTAGATAVGARPLLVAYNVWITVSEDGVPDPRGGAVDGQGGGRRPPVPAVRSLGLAVGTGAQVSCNLVDPDRSRRPTLYDAVARLVSEAGGTVEPGRAGGPAPAAALDDVPRPPLGRARPQRGPTIEARMESRGTPVGAAGRP